LGGESQRRIQDSRKKAQKTKKKDEEKSHAKPQSRKGRTDEPQMNADLRRWGSSPVERRRGMSLRAVGWAFKKAFSAEGASEKGVPAKEPPPYRVITVPLDSAIRVNPRASAVSLSLPFVLFVPFRGHSDLSTLRAFAALREILSSGFQECEAVGGPGLGADAVVDEEKAGGIVFFFDGF
jgi:hypothetical protein